jgi:hypothetical protein
MAQHLKVEYRIENENMSDEEWENQEEKTFIVTEEMIYELMCSHGCDGFDNKPENKGNEIDRSNMFLTLE